MRSDYADECRWLLQNRHSNISDVYGLYSDVWPWPWPFKVTLIYNRCSCNKSLQNYNWWAGPRANFLWCFLMRITDSYIWQIRSLKILVVELRSYTTVNRRKLVSLATDHKLDRSVKLIALSRFSSVGSRLIFDAANFSLAQWILRFIARAPDRCTQGDAQLHDTLTRHYWHGLTNLRTIITLIISKTNKRTKTIKCTRTRSDINHFGALLIA